MIPEIKSIVNEFASGTTFTELVSDTIVYKCRLNNQIRALQPVLETMIFRKREIEEIGYFTNPGMARLVWQGGLNCCKRQSDPMQFQPGLAQVRNFEHIAARRL